MMSFINRYIDTIARWLNPILELHDYEVDVKASYEFKFTILASSELEVRERAADELYNYLCNFITDTEALMHLVDTYEMECTSIKRIEDSEEE